MPERSRSSVAATPARTAWAISCPDSAMTAWGSRRSRARTQRQTAEMSRCLWAAAKSSGAMSAWARSTQWADSVSAAPGRAALPKAWAMATA